jgi:hypothetical protein
MIGLIDREDEFYIGYEPPIPKGIARRVRVAVVCIAVAAAAAAVIAITAQHTLPPSRFEFGVVREFTGTLRQSPYPVLETSDGPLWLVATGKFGAERQISGIPDGHVRVSGSLIQRGNHRMVEIATINPVSAPFPGFPQGTPGGTLGDPHSAVVLRGEIVDSKCYLGVMNPSEGAVHRDCARRCLSGGIPPMMAVRDGRGREALIVLASAHDRAVGRDLAPIAGRPVEVTGRLARHAANTFLYADPGAYRLSAAGPAGR